MVSDRTITMVQMLTVNSDGKSSYNFYVAYRAHVHACKSSTLAKGDLHSC